MVSPSVRVSAAMPDAERGCMLIWTVLDILQGPHRFRGRRKRKHGGFRRIVLRYIMPIMPMYGLMAYTVPRVR